MKKRIAMAIRGWFPKDPNLPVKQQTAAPKAAGNRLKMWVSLFVTWTTVAVVLGALSPAYAPERSWSLYFTATGIIIGVSFIILLVRINQTRAVRARRGAISNESV